jgi:hypothetical protein
MDEWERIRKEALVALSRGVFNLGNVKTSYVVCKIKKKKKKKKKS